MPRFILDENLRRTVLDLEKEVLLVGRAPVERHPGPRPAGLPRHCRIERHGAQYVLLDLGSQNGTRLNGQLVDRAAAQAGRRDRGRAAPGSGSRRRRPPTRRGARHDGASTLERGPRGPGRRRTGSSGSTAIAKALNSELHLDRLLAIILDHVIELSGRRARLPRARPRGGDGPRCGSPATSSGRRSPSPEEAFSRVDRASRCCAPGSRSSRPTRSRTPASRSSSRINAIRARSVIALPLVRPRAVAGAVYVDNRLQKGAFGAVGAPDTLDVLRATSRASPSRTPGCTRRTSGAARELEVLNRPLDPAWRHQQAQDSPTSATGCGARASPPAPTRTSGARPAMRDVLRLLDKIVQHRGARPHRGRVGHRARS